jgi:hypothetical protein
MKLLVAFTDMIACGHRDYCNAHYRLDMYPNNSNHTVNSLAKLLRNLESPSKYSSRQLFVGARLIPLFVALLEGASMCDGSLPPPLESLVPAALLALVLNIQLNNACTDNKSHYVFNKSHYVFSFCSLFVHRRCFKRSIKLLDGWAHLG